MVKRNKKLLFLFLLSLNTIYYIIHTLHKKKDKQLCWRAKSKIFPSIRHLHRFNRNLFNLFRHVFADKLSGRVIHQLLHSPVYSDLSFGHFHCRMHRVQHIRLRHPLRTTQLDKRLHNERVNRSVQVVVGRRIQRKLSSWLHVAA